MTLIQDLIKNMTEEELDATLALLLRRKCECNKECASCGWKGSILCLSITRYLRRHCSNGDEVRK